jgi:uncharacterized protein
MKSQDVFPAEPARGWLPWGPLAPILGLVFLIVTELPVTPIIDRLVDLDAKGTPVDGAGLLALLTIGFLPLLAIVLLWVWLVERRSLASIGIAGPGSLRRFLHGHMVGVLSILGIVAAIVLAGGLVFTSTLTDSATASAWASAESLLFIALLLPAFALQASTEEILFRGWLLSVVAKKLNIVLAVVLSSALFTLAHLSRDQHWLITLSSFVFAVFCCAWVLRTRSLLGVMGWHAGWNWMLAVGFGVPLTGIDVGIPALLVPLTPTGADWLSGGAEGPEGSVFCVAYFVAGSLALWFARRRRTQPPTEPLHEHHASSLQE